MNVYELKSMPARLEGNTYPGRGIVVGKTADGKHAAFAYFIMGRSANSRNRIFTQREDAVFTEPFDASKVEDPSLIIYAAIRKYENKLIVTNQMSILKSGDEEGSFCNRYTYSYGSAKAGVGHFLHTYVCDGNPIPTFQGEPERVSIPNDIDAWTTDIWNALDENNKISLYVRFVNLETGREENRMINRNK